MENTFDEKTLKHIGRLMEQHWQRFEEITQKLHPEFNLKKRDHEHTSAILGKYKFDDIDVDIAGLLERINLFEDEPLTDMSCQYDNFGWTSILFTLKGFEKWIQLLRKQYIKKYGKIGKYNKPNFIGLYKRFVNPHEHKLIVGEYAGNKNILIRVEWQIDPQDVPNIVCEFDDLFSKSSKKRKRN